MKSLLEAMRKLNETNDDWNREAEEIKKVLNDKYQEYVKNNLDNHLDYSNWLTALPQSYKDEISGR